MRQIVLDTETTGLEPHAGRRIIALVAASHGHGRLERKAGKPFERLRAVRPRSYPISAMIRVALVSTVLQCRELALQASTAPPHGGA